MSDQHTEEQTHQDTTKRLVLDAISTYCTSSSPVAEMRTIGHALEEGDTLKIEILSGGLTNYSFKVFLSGSQIALYAKLCFQYALWNPNRNIHYDLERTANEYKMMQRFHLLKPNCVAKPYLCLDLEGEMRLLVTQWCSNDEQWANQMIDGTVDMRIPSKLADTLATLHHLDFDPDFNNCVRPFTLELFPAIREKMIQGVNAVDCRGRTEALCKEFGEDLCSKIISSNIRSYNVRDCLVHSDFHAFNILVEKKPNAASLESFGNKGSFTICDWEMSFVGPIGRDIGFIQAFPITCLVSHALNGHVAIAESMMLLLEVLWDEYASAMIQRGVTKERLARIYRNSLGWNGFFLFLGCYMLGCNIDFLPVDTSQKKMVQDSAGALGLNLLRWGFVDEEDLTLDQLRTKYKRAIDDEVRVALSMKNNTLKPRRSSLLRASRRRISDTPLHFPRHPSSISGVSH